VRLDLKLDKGGAPVLIALPEKDTPNMADDPQLREMTCDPKFRRVLITDGRTAVGQAMARAFSEAGANIVFVGVADPWKPFPGEAALRKIGTVPLPPYIHEALTDAERYQTVVARTPGSAAAPTAALHFTPEILDLLRAKGVEIATVTLSVGIDTFVTQRHSLSPSLYVEGAGFELGILSRYSGIGVCAND